MTAPAKLTSNMVTALDFLSKRKTPLVSRNELGRVLDIRHTKGNLMGQKKVWGVGSAAQSVLRGLVSRGLVKEVLAEDWDGPAIGYVITDAGRELVSD